MKKTKFNSFADMKAAIESDNKQADIKKTKKKETFFATFGCGSAFAKNYVGFIAPSHEVAHAAMHELFGPKWAFMYSGVELIDQKNRFNLKPLCHILVVCPYEGESQMEIKKIAEEFFTAARIKEVREKE
ncbi:MAG: hypothetical protein V4721_00590 [Bacteroidota bacterium]